MSHILLVHPPEELSQILGLETPPAPRKARNVMKRDSIPVFTACHFGPRTMIEATWGVQVPWRRDGDDHMYYVRSDSIVYGDWLESLPNLRPCVIPASAMILYTPNDTKKPVHVLHRKDRQLMLFAGILSSAEMEGKVIKHGCLIMSTNAKKSLISGRWRIPFVLDDDEIDMWLDYDLLRAKSLFRKIDGFPFERLDCFECPGINQEIELMFCQDRPSSETLPLRSVSAKKDFSHVIVFKRLPEETEQGVFTKWFKKKREESRRLNRPLNTFWPEEKSSQEIRVSLLSR